MNAQTLSAIVVLMYLGTAVLGLLVGFFSINIPRYWPVVSLLGLALGTPSVGLALIRTARTFGYAASPNDISQQAIILVAFSFSLYCVGQAFLLILKERRRRAHYTRYPDVLPSFRVRVYRHFAINWRGIYHDARNLWRRKKWR